MQGRIVWGRIVQGRIVPVPKIEHTYIMWSIRGTGDSAHDTGPLGMQQVVDSSEMCCQSRVSKNCFAPYIKRPDFK